MTDERERDSLLEARAEKAERERDEAKRVLGVRIRAEQHPGSWAQQEQLDSARAALAVSQAREQELKALLNRIHEAVTYKQSHKESVDMQRAIEAALARPSDTSALREFGLKVYLCMQYDSVSKMYESLDTAFTNAEDAKHFFVRRGGGKPIEWVEHNDYGHSWTNEAPPSPINGARAPGLYCVNEIEVRTKL